MSERQEGDDAAPVTSALPGEQRERLAARLGDVRARMAQAAERSGRSAGAAQLVAVTKTVSVPTIRAAYELGLTTFAENRVQEARAKIAELRLPGVCWELIGHLQTNKAGQAGTVVDRIAGGAE